MAMRAHLLLKGVVDPAALAGIPEDLDITSVTADSREVIPGSLFAAVKGSNSDGLAFSADAVRRGARIVLGSSGIGKLPCLESPLSMSWNLEVNNPHQALQQMLSRFYNHPDQRLGVIGITGTNGKTTVTYLLESIARAANKACGVIGTVEHRFKEQRVKARNTTPGIVENYRLLSEMVSSGMDYCAMEVSSHALHQGRVAGIEFRTGIFTNLTSDHLDYHHHQEDYFLAKAMLFQNLSKHSTAVINMDDPFGRRLPAMTAARILTYGLKDAAQIHASGITMDLSGSRFILRTPVGECPMNTPLIGSHNIYNILAAAGALIPEGFSLEMIREGVERLAAVPGRMERVAAGQNFYVFIDFAHTEDALWNILTSLRQVSRQRIIVVFGCGGDRDRTKRPRMGRVAGELADLVFVTSDNPRSEEPEQIISEVVAGFTRANYTVEADRRTAIGLALRAARPADVVVIAGKGHEDYQIFKDRTIAFNERDIVRELLSGASQGPEGAVCH